MWKNKHFWTDETIVLINQDQLLVGIKAITWYNLSPRKLESSIADASYMRTTTKILASFTFKMLSKKKNGKCLWVKLIKYKKE